MSTSMGFGSSMLKVAICAVGVAGAVGCASTSKQVTTPHYTLTHPDYWQVKKVGQNEGEPTVVMVGAFGAAVIDDGSGSLEGKEANYESVQADVEARIYAWKDPAAVKDLREASQAVATMLELDNDLQLTRHKPVAEQPFECSLLKKKYTILGTQQSVLDLISRPGWRTIVVGARGHGLLVGVVTRVEFEQDGLRYCHNLSNMQVQLQNVLDAIVARPAVPAVAEKTAGAGASAGPGPGAGQPPGGQP